MLLASAAAIVPQFIIADRAQWSNPEYVAILLGTAAAHVVVAAALIGIKRTTALHLAVWLGVLASGLVAAALAVQFDGPATAGFWAVEALAMFWVWSRLRDLRAGVAAIAYIMLAVIIVLVTAIPPIALADGLHHVTEALLGGLSLAAVMVGCWMVSRHHRPVNTPEAPAGYIWESSHDSQVASAGVVARTAAPFTIWYLASALVVTVFTPDAFRNSSIPAPTDDASLAQLGLSVFWAVCGLSLLVAGLVRNNSFVRRTGIGFLALVAAKVLFVDTAQLAGMARVFSFLGVGVAFIGGALVYARVRDALETDHEKGQP